MAATNVHEEVLRLSSPANKPFLVNPYWVLECPYDATVRVVQSRYRALSMVLHPDKNECSDLAQEAFAVLNEARLQLVDPTFRRTCDVYIEQAKERAQRTAAHAEEAEMRRQIEQQLMQIFLEREEQRVKGEERQRAERLRQREQEQEEERGKKAGAELNTAWDQTQDKRVRNWKDFLGKKKDSKRARKK